MDVKISACMQIITERLPDILCLRAAIGANLLGAPLFANVNMKQKMNHSVKTMPFTTQNALGTGGPTDE